MPDLIIDLAAIPEGEQDFAIAVPYTAFSLESSDSMTIEQRRAIPVMEPGREDVIVAGAALAQVIMKVFGAREFLVSEYGLREGLLLDLLED